MLAPLILVLAALGGPAQTISGKYVQHSDEYIAHRRERDPSYGRRDEAYSPLLTLLLPDGPPIELLCAYIEAGVSDHMALLGEKLLAAGDGELAFRAFHRARELGHADPALMERKKDECPRVPLDVIRRERREADEWVKQFKSFERKRLAAGEDPDDLTEFYLLYGRAEQNMSAVMRNRRASFLGGVIGILIGLSFGAASRVLPRKLVVAPLLVGIALMFAPLALGQPGILRWGSGAAMAGAVLVWMLGRRA